MTQDYECMAALTLLFLPSYEKLYSIYKLHSPKNCTPLQIVLPLQMAPLQIAPSSGFYHSICKTRQTSSSRRP